MPPLARRSSGPLPLVPHPLHPPAFSASQSQPRPQQPLKPLRMSPPRAHSVHLVGVPVRSVLSRARLGRVSGRCCARKKAGRPRMGRRMKGLAEPRTSGKGLCRYLLSSRKPLLRQVISIFTTVPRDFRTDFLTGKDAEDKDAEGEEEGAGDTSFRSLQGGSGGEDTIDDFLKSDEDLSSEEEDEVEEEEAEEVGETGGSEQTAIAPSESPGPKPPSQKPSSLFDTSFTAASPTKPEKGSEPSKPAFTRAASTTPPGSPATERGSALAISRATSAPPAGAPGLTPGLLGVGRPSTRPTRSSPLASRPISGDDEGNEEEEPPRSPSETKKAHSAYPAVPVSAAAPSRPRTPPALFGATIAPPKVVPFTLSPAASPVTKSPDGGKPNDTEKGLLSGPASCGKGVFSAPVSQGGFFGQQPLGSAFPSPATPPATPATPGAHGSLVGQIPSVSTSGSIFSSPFTKFGSPSLAPPASAASPSPFNVATPPSTQSPQLAGWPQAGVTPTSRSESPVQSMLTEFTHLYNTLTRELEDVRIVLLPTNSRYSLN